jgi:hypothetical protein
MKRACDTAASKYELQLFPSTTERKRIVKTLISAVAVALSLGATVAHADVQASFPDGYVIVTDGNYAPVSAEVLASLPKPSFIDYVELSAEELTSEVATSVSSTSVSTADFPQPSFIAG